MLKERSQSFKLLFIITDLFNSIISFGIAFVYRYYIHDKQHFDLQTIDIQSYIFLSLVISLSQVISFISIDLYHPRRGLSFYDEFFTIIYGILVNLLAFLALLFFYRGESFSRLFILGYVIANIIVTTISHLTIRLVLTNLRKKGYNLRKLLVIGTSEMAANFADSVKKHQIYGYTIAGHIKTKQTVSKRIKNPVIGSIQDLEKIISKTKPDLVVYALSAKEGDYLKDALDFCDKEGIDLKLVPNYQEFITAKGRVEEMDGIPVISIRDIPIRLGYNRFIKRIFDILFSLFFIICFSPFYLIIALAVKLTSKGPIFIKQERVGLDHEKFFMVKFRTMYSQPKEKSDTLWTTKNDPRVTPVGSILRKISLDETPQFFNVLFGNMSVVGPRPERPFFVEQFKNNHRHYMRRHAVKAGITGWAQIQGLRGDTSIDKRIEADIFYIENWSLFFDIKIVLLTPFKGIMSKNAY